MPEDPTILFGCSQCRRRIKVSAKAAGRKFACPDCQMQLVVPATSPSAPIARRAGVFQVFISYSSKDKQWADAACAALEGMGVDCWIAPRDIAPGAEWGAAIIGGIDACKVMVLVFSAHANESPQVRREVERAINKGLVIVPLRVGNVIPSGAMEYALSNTHWLDAATPPRKETMLELAHATKAVLLGEVKPPRVTTKLLQSAGPTVRPVSPDPPKSRRSWLLLPVAGFLMLLACAGVGLVGWRFFPLGIKGDQEGKDAAKPEQRRDLINENFEAAFKAADPLPAGWKNEAGAFAVHNDPKNGKTCLKVVEKGGEHFVQLPDLVLGNNFFIEMDFLIHFHQQILTIELDSRKGGKKLRTVIQPLTGAVAVGEKVAGTPPNFKAAEINTIRLSRKGNVVTTEMNGERLSPIPFSGLADFDVVRIGLIAGDSPWHAAGSWARIYRVKVGTLPP